MLDGDLSADLPTDVKKGEIDKALEIEAPDEPIDHHPFTREEEIDLVKRAQAGDQDAMHRLIDANTGYMIRFASKYFGRGVDMKDLMQEARRGVVTAIERFDENEGVWLLTYAVWWMRHFVGRAVADQGKTVKIPVHVLNRCRRIIKATEVLNEEGYKDPTPEQIAEKTGDSPESIVNAQKAPKRTVSLDVPAGDDDDSEPYKHLLRDEDSPSAEQVFHKKRMREIVRKAMNRLSPREELIIKMRYGMDSYRDEYSLKFVGDGLDLTRERIRQIQNSAQKKLKRWILAELKQDRELLGEDADMVTV